MVISANLKSSIRLFKKHFTRFLTIAAVALVAISFTSGLTEVEEQVKNAATIEYEKNNLSDLYIKSKHPTGFTNAEKAYLYETFGEENIVETFCFEFKVENEIYRLYVMDMSKNDVNKLTYVAGEAPDEANEMVVERWSNGLKSYNLGDIVHLSVMGMEADFTISGVVFNPLFLYEGDNMSYQYKDENDNFENLKYVIYLDYSALSDLIGSNFSMVNDVYIILDEETREDFNAYSGKYKKVIDGYKDDITEQFGEDAVSPLSLFENYGLYSLVSYANKVGLISIVFVAFFLAVTLLVVYSAMGRLFTEERQQIACLKTLGYSDTTIVGKYLLFDVVATAVGGAPAYGVGLILTKLIYNAFNLMYTMPNYPSTGGARYYLSFFFIVVAVTCVLTLLTGLKTLRQKPVHLLTPKAPKAGRKVLVEKIPLIWNHLSFKYKSTVRNVLLFRSRFYMTVVSVIGSTVLVFAGLGLWNNAYTIPGGEMLVTISIFLVVFSALLCALVIYNLTNINVSERCREIATLMVLGYSDEEVTNYVYREIYVMCAIGALLGLPFGTAFVYFVFGWIGFGNLANIQWWTYLVTPVVTMMFCFLSTRLLQRKITKTDMNASLKTLE